MKNIKSLIIIMFVSILCFSFVNAEPQDCNFGTDFDFPIVRFNPFNYIDPEVPPNFYSNPVNNAVINNNSVVISVQTCITDAGTCTLHWFNSTLNEQTATLNLLGGIVWFYNVTNLTLQTTNGVYYYNVTCTGGFIDSETLSLTFNLSQPVACVEDWIQNDTICNGQNYTIQFYDNNMCGTFDDLPLSNGTIINCASELPTGFVIKQVDTTDLINAVISLLVIILLVSIFFALTNEDETIKKYLYYVIGMIIVILMFYFLVATFS